MYDTIYSWYIMIYSYLADPNTYDWLNDLSRLEEGGYSRH